MSDITREIVLGFVEEATGYLPAVRAGLAAFRANPTDPAPLDEPHRCVHTIKGASAMIGLPGLSHIAFHLEEVVEQLLHEPDTATPEVLDGIDAGVAYIEAYLAGLAGEGFDDVALVADALRHVRQLRGLPPEEPAAAEPTPAPVPESAAAELPPPEAGLDDLAFPDLTLTPPPTSVDWPELPEEFAAPPLPEFAPPTPADIEPFTPPVGAKAEEPAPVAGPSAELLEVFRLEAEDHIRVLASLLPEARNDPSDADRWQVIRRSVHTLKGTAGLVGFHDVTRLTHRMEDLLDLYFEGGRAATREEIDLLLAATDAVEDAVAGRASPAVFADLHARLGVALAEQPAQSEVAAAPAAEEPAAAPAVAEAPAEKPAEVTRAAGDPGESYVRVPIARLDEIAKLVGELVIARTAMEQRAAEFGRMLGEARTAAGRLSRVATKLEVGYEARALAGSRGGGAFALVGGGGGSDEGFDDLEFDRYTEFHLMSRELAETVADVQTVVGEFGYLLGEFDGHVTRQARVASEVEDKLMRLRMVPLGAVAGKLHRTVRTAATATNKKAELVLEGERTGLDKTVLEAMADPLLHLLRNAVDHGLESPEVRLALGKPAQGTVTLRAIHEGSSVVLTIADDGRGIDFEEVRATAVRRGLVPPDETARLTEVELGELLFRPGFTTRSEVSELSGRGVGLDVVRSKVESLKGTVAVASAAGRGTTFTVRLPMTLAVLRALLVRAGDCRYAIPLETVEQVVRPGEGDLDRIGRDPVLRVGGSVCPLTPLTRALRQRAAAEPSAHAPVVVVNAAGRRVALQVDQLLGGREVVVKSLGRHLHRLPAVSGATLMGDGGVVLILNPAELTRWAVTPAAPPADFTPARSRDGRTVLVVDDSASVRRVLTMLLKGVGWQAVTAKDGLEALELLQRGTAPDVVLTDVEMPRMDGYELLATIRGEPGLQHLPVAVLTSRAADKHRRKALDLGASAYVVKPYQDENLLDILRQLARSARPAEGR